MLCRLLESPFPILAGMFAKFIHESSGALLGAQIQELTPREFPKIIQCVFEAYGIEISVKDNGMHVIRQDYIRIGAQEFILMAIIQTLYQAFVTTTQALESSA